MTPDAFTVAVGARRGESLAARYRGTPALRDFVLRLDHRDLGIRLQNGVGEGCMLGPVCEGKLAEAGRDAALARARADLEDAVRTQGVKMDDHRRRALGYALIAQAGVDILEERDLVGLWMPWYNAFWEPLTGLDGQVIAGLRGDPERKPAGPVAESAEPTVTA